MIPYRFTFLYSFVILYMAYRAYLLRNRFRLWQIIVACVLAFGIILCANDLSDIVYWAYNGVFLFLYSVTLICPHLHKLPKKDAPIAEKRAYVENRKYKRVLRGQLFLAILLMELALNLINFGVNFPGTVVSNYPQGTVYTESMIRYMKEKEEDTLFYRAEVTHAQTLNDGALNNYNGISTFTSSANVRVTKFMKALGYGAKESYNRYCFEESSPVSNLFLALKYMLERQGQVEENAYFDDVHHYGNVHLLKNNAYLPLGFLAESQLLDVDFNAEQTNFAFQNSLFRAATGVEEDVWHFISGQNLSISGSSVIINAHSLSGYCSYSTDAKEGGYVIYKYVADAEGLLCIDLDLSKRNSFAVWKNDIELYSETYSVSQTLSVCQVVPGDVIEIYLSCKSNERGSIIIQAGILDDEIFQKGYDTLADSTLELTCFQNTLVEGDISCNRDGVLYTSIPQDGNWKAYVDGETAEIVLIGDAMVGLALTEGTHNVKFVYENDAFSLGWKISLVSFIVFAGLYWSTCQPKHNKGRHQK